MLNFLEDAVNAYYVDEHEIAIECIHEVDYALSEIEEPNSVEQELVDFVEDIVYAHKQKNYDDALLYAKMAIDLTTLPIVEGYRYNEAGLNTVSTEIDKHTNIPIDGDNPIECIEWDIKYRKLRGRLTKLLIADHRARFGEYALLA